MKKIASFIRDSKGEAYIDMLIKLAVFASLIMFVISFFPLTIQKLKLDGMASRIARTIELTGRVGTEYATELSRMSAATGLNPNVSIQASFLEDNKIQLRDSFIVTVRTTADVKLFEPSFSPPVVITIPISKTIVGYSEVYWKPST